LCRRLLVVLAALCAVACWLPAASLAQLSWSRPAAIDDNGHQSLGGVACPSATAIHGPKPALCGKQQPLSACAADCSLVADALVGLPLVR
jgi:hypothetical protein